MINTITAITTDNKIDAVSAVNKFKKIVLNELTSETPDTAASPTKPMTNTSAIPTNARSNCSKNNGMIRFFKSLFENIFENPPNFL